MNQHTFKVGDVVRSKFGTQEMEVLGEKEGYPGMLLCRWTEDGNPFEMSFWPQNLTLIMAAAEKEKPD